MDAAAFKTRFPEFASVEDVRVNAAIADAILSVNARVWGGKTLLGVCYLAAHILALTSRGGSGPAGPVVAESVGDMSRTYANTMTSAGSGSYSSTSYGVEYLRLRKSVIISPMIL